MTGAPLRRPQSRERQVADAFVALADGLVGAVDLAHLLSGLGDSCVRLLGVGAAGLLVADGHGVLRVLAASTASPGPRGVTRLLRVSCEEGPALDCHRTGEPVLVPTVRPAASRWRQWAAATEAAGFAAASVLPLRRGDDRLGALALFADTPGGLADDDAHLAGALAHLACVAVVQDKALSEHAAVTEQLRTALSSRIVLEQAKGALGQQGTLSMDESFALLRLYAREHNQRLADVARAVVERRLPAQRVLGRRGQPTTDA